MPENKIRRKIAIGMTFQPHPSAHEKAWRTTFRSAPPHKELRNMWRAKQNGGLVIHILLLLTFGALIFCVGGGNFTFLPLRKMRGLHSSGMPSCITGLFR